MKSMSVDESGINELISKVELRVVPLRDRKRLIDNNFSFREEHGVYLILTIPLEISVKESGVLGSTYAVITKNVVDYLAETGGKTEDELFELAKYNTANKSIIIPMAAVMVELLAGMGKQVKESDLGNAPIWIITNEERIYGAAGFVIPEVLKKAADTIGDKRFYILPSSIHEVIVVPKKQKRRVFKESLSNLVWEVNQAVVSPVDFLSNNIYEYYDGKLWETSGV